MKGLLKILVCCVVYFGYTKASADDIKFDCLSCLKGTFTGETNLNMTIQVAIKAKSFTILKIKYNQTLIISVSGIGKIVVQIEGGRWISQEQVTQTDSGSKFNITMMNLSKDDNDKSFSYIYTDSAIKDFSDTIKISVLASPKFKNDWKEQLNINEGKDLSFSFSLSGNPQPNVSVNFADLNFNVNAKAKTETFEYSYDASSIGNVNRSQCGKELTVSASSVGTSTTAQAKAQVMVIFVPVKPIINTAKIDLKKCLTVDWSKVEAGNCKVTYTLKFGNETLSYNTTNVIFNECNERYNISSTTSLVFVKAIVNGKESNYSHRNITIVQPTTSPTEPTKKKVTGGGGSEFPEYAIIIVAVVGFIILVVIFLVILACCNVITCFCFGKDQGKRNSRTKPSSDEERRALKAKSSKGDTSFTVTFQNIHNQDVKLLWKDFNGEESPVQIIDSKKDCMEKVYITYSFIARDITNNQLLYFTDNKKTDVVYEGLKFGAERDQVYNIIITSKPPLDVVDGKSKKSKKRMNGSTNHTFVPDSTEMKPVEGEYAVVTKPRNKPIVESNYSEAGYFEKPQNSAPSQPLDYAELGPGGRTGDRPTPVRQSDYAQVNTQAGNYPPLQNDKHMPIYAVSSKAKNRLPAPDPPIAVDDDDDMSIVV